VLSVYPGEHFGVNLNKEPLKSEPQSSEVPQQPLRINPFTDEKAKASRGSVNFLGTYSPLKTELELELGDILSFSLFIIPHFFHKPGHGYSGSWGRLRDVLTIAKAVCLASQKTHSQPISHKAVKHSFENFLFGSIGAVAQLRKTPICCGRCSSGVVVVGLPGIKCRAFWRLEGCHDYIGFSAFFVLRFLLLILEVR
jgi:hypothetical protein